MKDTFVRRISYAEARVKGDPNEFICCESDIILNNNGRVNNKKCILNILPLFFFV
jgi:hypothetical protein